MKIGMRITPGTMKRNIASYSGMFDYFEMYANPETDFSAMHAENTEINVHAAHIVHGFDLGDASKNETNNRILNKAKEAADALGSDTIVIHPGLISSPDSKKIMIEFLGRNYDERFAFENCILYDKTQKSRSYLFSTPDEMAQLVDMFGARFVFDIGHAICTANSTGKNPHKMISEFMELKPDYFHLSGIDIDSTYDTHHHLAGTRNNYAYIRDMPANSRVTLECGVSERDPLSDYLSDLSIIKQVRNNQFA